MIKDPIAFPIGQAAKIIPIMLLLTPKFSANEGQKGAIKESPTQTIKAPILKTQQIHLNKTFRYSLIRIFYILAYIVF
ncbi:hypothetical protein pb186bvf_016514 [Paramecium bursaria]